MTLREATTLFLESAYDASTRSTESSLALLADHYDSALADFTPQRLRDFIAPFWVERKCSDLNDQVPSPAQLLDSLAQFFRWAARHAGYTFDRECEEIIRKLEMQLPRAIEVFHRLSRNLAGGAFGFAEFLTTFEEGGRARYDFDLAGEVGAREGYFRVLKVEGCSIEAEEMITAARVSPVLFPEEVACLMEEGMVINLEIVRSKTGWQIIACGFVYPPGTEV